MKKVQIIGSILLFLAAGVAIAYGADRARSVAMSQEMAREALVEIQHAQDMAKVEGQMGWMDAELANAAEAKEEAKRAFGGAAVLLLGSVVLFFRGRRPRTALRPGPAAVE
jgi:hypothetical protein